ncbi:DNA (cytosine-5-)-methyltransferase 3 beta, duplicate a isoform X2 [Melanotaenia boesemani]|nr:DNA (cytosine-5-)-methyltransferase 3 beta, duplicate a isoform X2 [Melanotaenia boesemani]
MESPEVVPPESLKDKSSRFYIVTWINKLLKTNFKDVREMGSGACYCQMMDRTFPGSVDMTKVKFDAQSEDDCKHNFALLRDAFSKKGITRDIPVEALMKGDFKRSFEFLKWFKVFYASNVKSKDNNSPNSTSPQLCNSKSESDTEKNGSVTSNKTFPYTEKWKETFDWADRSKLGEEYTYCSSCRTKLHTFHKGSVELKRHEETRKHKKRAKISKSNGLQGQVSKPLPYSKAAVRFIRFFTGSANSEQVSRLLLSQKLGLQYHKYIESVLQHTPYCVYIYGGVAVGKEDSISVVLVGFYDVESSRHCVCFLDALQSADGSGDQTVAAVVQTLKKFGLPTDNLVAVYFSGDHEASEQIHSQLKQLNPNIIALGGLYTIADAACHAGVKELSSQTQKLMEDIHAHYLSCSTKNDNLKALFSSDDIENSTPFYPNTSCLRFCQFVMKILEKWADLIFYFSSCDKNDAQAKLICSQLKDPKVKATFMFLKEALKPLQNFQTKTQGASWATMPRVLEEASTLLDTYTSHFLQSHAAAHYLKGHDAQILTNKKSHLQSPKFSQDGRAVENFLKTSDAVDSLPQLQEEALSFYIAVTSCIAEELPLSGKVLRSIAQLLNPEKWLQVTNKAVEELGTKLGVCSSPEEVKQLMQEFTENQSVEEKKNKEDKDNTALVPLEKHWGRVLKDSKPTSVLRKLILTLLSFPCPPLEAKQVITRALGKDVVPLFSESETLTESECDVMSDNSLSDSANRKDSQVHIRGINRPDVQVRPCEVRLTKMNYLPDHSGLNGTPTKEGTCRGGFGWESTLRQKPQARTVFQAGANTWSKPVDLDTNSKNGLESKDEVVEESSSSGKATPTRARRKNNYQDGKGFPTGELVWGKTKGFTWWPGMVMPWKTKSPPPGLRRVEWFGDGKFSEINVEKLLPFGAFSRCFCKNSFAGLPLYKEAIYQIIELVSERCGKSFAEADGNREKELKMMVDWAFEGFLPRGPEGFTPPESTLHQESSDNSLSDNQPPPKRKYVFKNKSNALIISYNRESIAEKVREQGRTIENFCLSCGSTEIYVLHPLFEGGLCIRCKDNFTETLYRYDEDGYQSYCTVCCAGTEVILCGNTSCCRCFCKDCLDILVGAGTFDKLKDVDPWSCYMCLPSQCEGNLKLRPDWSAKVQDLFVNNSAMEFEPHRVYPSIPADQRKPMRVLSLFDGIATGYLVLRDLGFKIERYIASEICDNSIAVGMIKHKGKIEYVNDVRTITRKHLAEWGPFDLLIGGSPCNDLSMVNPLRKGLYEGTGRLFFEFYRILTLLKPRKEDNRPFFWLFENVVFMSSHDKYDICRFLECNPVLIDAVKVSPAHRARYFWGNIPGMSRPIAISLDNRATLQDCLEVGRMAKFDKVRTITTKSNSIRQGKMGPLPVTMNGKEDYLWCTEMEQVFGFPKHYTDVNNMGRMQRQKVLGRSWSVPVIRHLFAPLKDYFECE